MKLIKKNIFQIVCILIGSAMIASAAAVVICNYISRDNIRINGQKALEKAELLMPMVVDTFPEERYVDAMPSMEIEGVDVGGIIEVPKYNYRSVLNASWDKNMVSSIPCRFIGSVYNRSLVIGAGDSGGQFDFANKLDAGDYIYVTDMEGGRYTYVVEKIQHSQKAVLENLQYGNWDLTVFVKDSSRGEYLLIRCYVK